MLGISRRKRLQELVDAYRAINTVFPATENCDALEAMLYLDGFFEDEIERLKREISVPPATSYESHSFPHVR